MSNPPAVSFAERYNPFVSPQLEDPYPTYAVARREVPVFYSPVLSLWVVARHDDVVSIYRDHETFSSSIFLQSHTRPTAEVTRVLAEGGYARKPLTVDNEPPDHTRVRAAVNKAFTPARVARLEPAIRALAGELA
jgi:cytochrome P450